jgi:multiple antibiotic resistance protein
VADLLDPRFLVSVYLTLFVIMDPPGIIPIFLALTARRGAKVMSRLALQAALTSFGVIVVFALFGERLLSFLKISLPALQASGGLLLLIVALELLTGKTDEPTEVDDVNVAMVPLGTPLLAGPGAIVATILFVRQADSTPQITALVLGIVLMHVTIYLTMRYSTVLARILKPTGILVLTRIAGLLLAAIAVQLVADGVFGFIEANGG